MQLLFIFLQLVTYFLDYLEKHLYRSFCKQTRLIFSFESIVVPMAMIFIYLYLCFAQSCHQANYFSRRFTCQTPHIYQRSKIHHMIKYFSVSQCSFVHKNKCVEDIKSMVPRMNTQTEKMSQQTSDGTQFSSVYLLI